MISGRRVRRIFTCDLVVNAAVHGHGTESGFGGQLFDRIVSLLGELPGRRNDKHAGSAAIAAKKALKDGQDECGRFAGSRLGEAQKVAAFEDGRNGLGLDRRWSLVARGIDARCYARVKRK